jgi:Arc/MetJ-type ribon-helix-helix transcriptional regulator
MLKSMSGAVRTSIQECESKIQSVKHANESEVIRINKAISSLEAKITAWVAKGAFRRCLFSCNSKHAARGKMGHAAPHASQ